MCQLALRRAFSSSRVPFSQLVNELTEAPISNGQKTSSSNDITHSLRAVPTFTGAGPFVESPRFSPLGVHSSLLNVTLPASAILNLRNNSVLAANGEIGDISTKLSLINLWSKRPLLFNQISSTSPVSLILSNKNTNASFINLELDELDQWHVFNTNNLVGWYGSSLEISSGSVGIKVQANDSTSNLILSGKGQLFTLNLDQDEAILLRPSSIVGFTSKNTTKSDFKKLRTSKLNIELPQLSILETLKLNYHSLVRELSAPQETPAEPLKPSESEPNKAAEYFKSLAQEISTKFNNFRYKNSLFYEIKGPATIIVQNDHSSVSRLFTSDQLSKIYKELN